MKTQHAYIYYFSPKSRSPYFLVRFRNNKGSYVQSAFANKNEPAEALKRAIKFRDRNIPSNRTVNSRNLLNKPLKNKTSDLPAGITLTSYIAKRKNKLYKYHYFYITAGLNNENKVISKRVCLTQERSYNKALKEAMKYRKELAKKYNKTFSSI